MNTVKAFQGSDIAFDVFCVHDWSDAHDAELESSGTKRFRVFHNRKPNLFVRLTVGLWMWHSLLKKKRYDIVHINTMNGTGFLYAYVAKKAGIHTRIVHSHNTNFGDGAKQLKSFVHTFAKNSWGNAATIRLACSDDAGRYLFGRNHFATVDNGIDCGKFIFSLDARTQVRKKLCIPDDTLLIGSIGRLTKSKNPLFQIDTLVNLLKLKQRAALLLVGDGPLKQTVLTYAKQQKVDSLVFLPQATDKKPPYYSALDVFTMPSLFEGLGISRIEALTSGLPCLIEKHIPDISIASKLEVRLPLDDPKVWAHEIITLFNSTKDSNRAQTATRKIIENVYGLEKLRLTLEKFYI